MSHAAEELSTAIVLGTQIGSCARPTLARLRMTFYGLKSTTFSVTLTESESVVWAYLKAALMRSSLQGGRPHGHCNIQMTENSGVALNGRTNPSTFWSSAAVLHHCRAQLVHFSGEHAIGQRFPHPCRCLSARRLSAELSKRSRHLSLGRARRPGQVTKGGGKS